MATTKSVAMADYRSAAPLNIPNIAAILPPKVTRMTFFHWTRDLADVFLDSLNDAKEII